jgi:hypothetical protein
VTDFVIVPAQSRVTRIHSLRLDPHEFGGPRPLPLVENVARYLYAAGDDETAFAEALFDDVPVAGVRALPAAALRGRALSHLAPLRDLRLVEIRNAVAIQAPVSRQGHTIAMADGIHAREPEADGLTWPALRSTGRRALMLFGDRVRPDELGRVDGPLPLEAGAGRELAETLAMRVGVALVL